jgi:hypothetical protein
MGDLITDHCCQSNRIDPKHFLHLDSGAVRVRIGKGCFQKWLFGLSFRFLLAAIVVTRTRHPKLGCSVCAQLWGFSAIGDLTDSVQAAPTFFTWPLDYNFGPQRR